MPIIRKIKIPLPPINVQEDIVKEVESYQKEIIRLYDEIKGKEENIVNRIAKVWGE